MIQVENITPLVLVAIASYGRAQDHYLTRLLAEYRKLHMRVRAIVLTNERKAVDNAELLVGLPSPDPYSLPFAHRKLFGENADRYDLFIYAEDDTLITAEHIEAFLEVQSRLEEDEIAGFLRSETDEEGHRFITSIHHHFRWLPESVVARGGELFARMSNEHSGCFMMTRKQLKKAIASGGFLVPPHAERYGMLESAASDLYTQCGLRRLVSISRIQDFIVPHLPNKYYHHMGIPVEDLELQVDALRGMPKAGTWTGKLFEPDSGARGFRWSRDLYGRADEVLLRSIPAEAQNILSVGCGSGENEKWLIRQGKKVTAIPLDIVFDRMLKRWGVRTALGPFPQVLNALQGERFDGILLADVLHLIEEPTGWLQQLTAFLEPNGHVIASVPNTNDVIERAKGWREWHKVPGGFQKVNRTRLRNWCRAAGLHAVHIVPLLHGSKRQRFDWAPLKPLLASRFLLTASRGDSMR